MHFSSLPEDVVHCKNAQPLQAFDLPTFRRTTNMSVVEPGDVLTELGPLVVSTEFSDQIGGWCNGNSLFRGR